MQIEPAGRQENKQANVTITQRRLSSTIVSYCRVHQSLVSTSIIRLIHLCANILVERDSSLDGRLVPHSLQTLGPLIKLECFIDNTVDLDFASIEVVNGSGD